MATWQDLPWEIQSEILDLVATTPIVYHQIHEPYRPIRSHRHSLSSYAVVCGEWQQFFETKNFRRLTLESYRLPELDEKVGKHRRHLVKYICIKLRLQFEMCCVVQPALVPPGMDVFQVPRSARQRLRDEYDSKLSDALSFLFGILSQWSTIPQSEGITLEVGVHDAIWEPVARNEPLLSGHELKFPKVPIVSGLILDRLNFPFITGTTLEQIFQSLSSLKRASLRISFKPYKQHQDPDDGDISKLVQKYLPEKLETLVLFEYMPETIHRDKSNHAIPKSRSHGKVLASTTQTLKDVSLAYITEAEDFFGACSKITGNWPHLTSVALTSRLLSPTADRSEMNEMLLAAARAARRMPSLRILEIWYDLKGHAAVFRYEAARVVRSKTPGKPPVSTPALLATQTSWDVRLCPRVVEEWKRVAGEDTMQELDVSTSLIPVPKNPYATILGLLKVLHPMALKHIS